MIGHFHLDAHFARMWESEDAPYKLEDIKESPLSIFIYLYQGDYFNEVFKSMN